MKMGEIRAHPNGGFWMMTPDGPRDVTLRCTVKGVVEVEEVSGGGLSIRTLTINMLPSPPTPAEIARHYDNVLTKRREERL